LDADFSQFDHPSVGGKLSDQGSNTLSIPQRKDLPVFSASSQTSTPVKSQNTTTNTTTTTTITNDTQNSPKAPPIVEKSVSISPVFTQSVVTQPVTQKENSSTSLLKDNVPLTFPKENLPNGIQKQNSVVTTPKRESSITIVKVINNSTVLKPIPPPLQLNPTSSISSPSPQVNSSPIASNGASNISILPLPQTKISISSSTGYMTQVKFDTSSKRVRFTIPEEELLSSISENIIPIDYKNILLRSGVSVTEEIDRLHNLVIRGTMFTKYGKGLPHKRYFKILENYEQLTWVDPNIDGDLDRAILLRDVLEIHLGTKNEAFTKAIERGLQVDEKCAFTIVTKHRTINLEASSGEECDDWVKAFKLLTTVRKLKSKA